jgi:hypothetical protein
VVLDKAYAIDLSKGKFTVQWTVFISFSQLVLDLKRW